MLRELHISNLAVIEDARIELDDGLNCFTGQTGAGKSLVLGAFEILLGLRSGAASEMLRPGADEARVSGVFELADADTAAEAASLLDIDLAAGDELLVTRKLFASGRSSVSVNGQPVTASMVRAVGELLVDIHGQHDHQYLLKPSNQLRILDAFAHAADLRKAYAQLHAELRQTVDRRAELRASGALRRQQLELYEFQAQEIDAAAPTTGEYDELAARHRVLSNIARIQREAGQAGDALYDSEGSVVERGQMIAHVLGELAEVDGELAEVAEQIRSAVLALQDGAYELSRYLGRLDADPGELAEIEDRLNTLNRLIAKYGDAPGDGDAVEQLLTYRAQIQGEIDTLRGQSADLEQIDTRIAALGEQMRVIGGELSQKRKAAAGRLKKLVEVELKELGMADAAIEVAFEPTADGDPASGGASGLETIELLIRTNAGQPARPLRRIASGGEMSRIMLALKSILATADRISVLVFDEIDANIGGRLGAVIGQKLRELATGVSPHGNGQRQQVLCITHLPQIAAFAHRHLRVAKTTTGKGRSRTTATQVNTLDGAQRIEELAEMLAGRDVTATTRKQAKELLTTAAAGT